MMIVLTVMWRDIAICFPFVRKNDLGQRFSVQCRRVFKVEPQGGSTPLDINTLRIYCAVAAEGSITRAADRLHYVPSNVTARIRQLERELGVILLERHPKGVCLTSAGILFRMYAEKIVQLKDEAVDVLHDPVHVRGTLRIGAIESADATYMTDILAAYHHKFPDVTMHFVTAETPQLYEALKHRDIDGAVVDGPVDDLRLIQEPLYEERLVLISSLNRDISSLQTLSALPVLLPFATCSYGTRQAQWAQTEDIAFTHTMNVGTLDGIMACVAKGFGISVLPFSALAGSQYSGQLAWRPLKDPYGTVPIFFVRPNQRILSRPLDAFIGIMRHVIHMATKDDDISGDQS